VFVRRPSDRGRDPVGQLVWPLGNYTGKDAITRAQMDADFRARMAERKAGRLT
jgi:hypothetical protein